MQTSGKLFVVTGGGNDIGREVVLALPRESRRTREWPSPAAGSARAGSHSPRRPTPAGQIVAGIQRGAYRVVIGRDARLLDRFSRLLPRRATDTVVRRMASLLGG
jgi:hypothetical protein